MRSLTSSTLCPVTEWIEYELLSTEELEECDVLVVYGRRVTNKDEAWKAATDRPKGKWLGTGHKTDMFNSLERSVLREHKRAKAKAPKAKPKAKPEVMADADGESSTEEVD